MSDIIQYTCRFMTTQVDHKFIITFANVPGIYMYLLKSRNVIFLCGLFNGSYLHVWCHVITQSFDCCIKKFGVCRNCRVCLSICPSVQSCLVHISLTEEHWKFLLYTMIALDLRVSHDFDPRSFGQGQGHWKEREHNSCLIYIFRIEKHGKFLLSPKGCFRPEGVS